MTDITTQKKAPTLKQGKPVKEAPKPPTQARIDALQEKLVGFYTMAGFLLTQYDTYDGLVIIKGANDRATELVNVAKHNTGLFVVLESLVESNDYFALVMGHGMVAYAILSHHNRVPANDALLKQAGLHESDIYGPLAGKDDGLYKDEAPLPAKG